MPPTLSNSEPDPPDFDVLPRRATEAAKPDAEVLTLTAFERTQLRQRADDRIVHFPVGRVNLQIPRNYLAGRTGWAGGVTSSVRIEVVYPRMQSFSADTRACFEQEIQCPRQELAVASKILNSIRDSIPPGEISQ